MRLLAWLKSFELWCIDFLLCERSARRFATGVTLSIWLGFFPLLSPQSFLVVVALLLIPLPLILPLCLAPLARLGRSFAEPVSHEIGRTLLSSPSLKGFWTFCYELPLLPYTRFNETIKLGGTVFGISLGLILGIITFVLLTRKWKQFVDYFEESPFWNSLARTSLGKRYLYPPPRARAMFRWQAFGLIAIAGLAGLPVLFAVLPSILQTKAQQTLSALFGLPVRIKEVKVQPWSPALILKNITLFRPDGAQAVIGLEQLRVQVAYGPLFTKKILVTELTVDGVRLVTSGATGNDFNTDSDSALAENEEEGTQSLSQHLAANLFHQVLKRSGVSPLRQMADLGSSLELSRRVTPLVPRLEITRKLKNQEAEFDLQAQTWTKTANDLLSSAIFAPWSERLREIGKDPAAREAFRSDLAKKIAEVDKAVDELQSDLERRRRETQALREEIPAAVAQIRTELQLPRFDGDDATEAVFGATTVRLIERLALWADRFRKYSSLQNTQQSGVGEIHHFYGPDSLPQFLLARAEIRSRSDGSTGEGNAEGFLSNVTSHPQLWRKPMEAEVKFEFPRSFLKKGKIRAKVDHTGKVPREQMQVDIDDISLARWEVSPPRPLGILYEEGHAKVQISATFEGDGLSARASLAAWDARPHFQATDRRLQDALQEALGNLPSFTLNGQLDGTVQEPKLELESEWGKRLQKVLREAYQAQQSTIDDATRHILLDEIEPLFKKRETELTQGELHTLPQLQQLAQKWRSLALPPEPAQRTVSSTKRRRK